MLIKRLRIVSLKLRFRLINLLNRLGLAPPEVHYIGSNEVLPPPLSPEEEQGLLVRLQAGGDLNVRTTPYRTQFAACGLHRTQIRKHRHIDRRFGFHRNNWADQGGQHI